MKTSELLGNDLDHWVALALGWRQVGDFWYGPTEISGHVTREDDPIQAEVERFHPSRFWAQGGPIIERERISVYQADAGDWSGLPRGWLSDPDRKNPYVRGPTLLIAAMRAYVATKLGEDVPDIPHIAKS